MFSFMRYGRWLSCVAAFAMVASPLLAAESGTGGKTEKVFDVTISSHGALVGQVVNAAGQPQANAAVAIISKTAVLRKTKTDARGFFQLPADKQGVYRIALADRSFTVRAWQPELAPPSARNALLCVAGQTAVRGQCGACGSCDPCACGPAPCGPCGGGYGGSGFGGGKLASILTNPVVIGLGVATAIALPIALDDDDDDNHGNMGDAS